MTPEDCTTIGEMTKEVIQKVFNMTEKSIETDITFEAIKEYNRVCGNQRADFPTLNDRVIICAVSKYLAKMQTTHLFVNKDDYMLKKKG